LQFVLIIVEVVYKQEQRGFASK